MSYRVLAVLAHPDDETGSAGALAMAAAGGHHVALACATRGEVGEISASDLATPDTLGAVQEVQTKGGAVMGCVNVVGSTIARTCARGVYLHSGPEIAVASTKAFTSQVTAMLVFTLMLARTRSLSLHEGRTMASELDAMPAKVASYLQNPGPIAEAVELIKDAPYVLFLGRGYSYPVALEGAPVQRPSGATDQGHELDASQ